MNASLRFASKRFPEEWTAHLKGNKYTNTVYACNSLLRKFSQISHIPKNRCAIDHAYARHICLPHGGRGCV